VEAIEVAGDLAAGGAVEAGAQFADDSHRLAEGHADFLRSAGAGVAEASAALFEVLDGAVVEHLDQLLGGSGHDRVALVACSCLCVRHWGSPSRVDGGG